ncbi:MAG TPA: glutamine amidotransferase, partial [Isosphaeraceae bacterium]|nr:glutamine amidotransferase [Isosphaeraceae bacterium]
SGLWRWFALGLRLAAVLLCILAALRPSLLILKKVKQSASVLFLTDVSESMSVGGEVGDRTRIEAARDALKIGLKAVKSLGPETDAKTFLFDTELREDNPETTPEPDGRLTGLGSALEELAKRFQGSKILRVFLLSDGRSNTGLDPRAVAQALGNQKILVDTVGFGTESMGLGNRDIAIRDFEAGPTVYAKTELEVLAKLDVRGYAPGEVVDVELLVDDKPTPVVRMQYKVPSKASEMNLKGLKWTPELPGETKLTIRVPPKPDEQVKDNNETSTFVSVLKGGITVLYLQGPSSVWERKFLVKAIDASKKIQLKLEVFYEPAGRDLDLELSPKKYDVFILGDLPADFLSNEQKRRLADAVEAGSGLIMLGGVNSFGSGGWAGTALANLLPVAIHPGDGQIEPANGIKVVPNTLGLDSYVLSVGPTRAETASMWEGLPPISGTNRFAVKPAARLWAVSPQGDPLMAAIDTGKSRTIAFGGETWPWARDLLSENNRRLHLNFWRNVILWLAHKEDEGENQIRLELDRRRVALGQKLDIQAMAQDGKGEPLKGVNFTATLTPEDKPKKPPTTPANPDPNEPKAQPSEKPSTELKLFRDAEGARASYSYFATRDPGTYKVEVKATRDGQTIGTAS